MWGKVVKCCGVMLLLKIGCFWWVRLMKWVVSSCWVLILGFI